MGASNGLFTGEDVIQAEVEIDSREQENLRKVVDHLVAEGVLLADYNGLDADGIIAQYQETGQPVDA